MGREKIGNGEETPAEVVSIPKTKLDIVREQLQANPNLYITGEAETFHGLESSTTVHEVNFFVSTPDSHVTSVELLNAQLDQLISGLPDISKGRFRLLNNNLVVGELALIEAIGNLKRVATSTVTSDEPETLAEAGIKVGCSRKIDERILERRIRIKLYPSALLAGYAHACLLHSTSSLSTDRDLYDKYGHLLYEITPDNLAEVGVTLITDTLLAPTAQSGFGKIKGLLSDRTRRLLRRASL